MDPVFEGLWKQVLDRWNEDLVHGAFLDDCQRAGQLVDAAVRYRGVAADRDRVEAARRRPTAISVLALVSLVGLVSLESTRTLVPAARRRSAMLPLSALLLSVLAAVLTRLGWLLE